MKRVSGYQTTDGKLFTGAEKSEARDHQKALNVVIGLRSIGNQVAEDQTLTEDEYGNRVIMDSGDFANFVLKHAEAIKLALEGKLVPVPLEESGEDLETPEA